MRQRSEDTAAPTLPVAQVRLCKPSRKRGGQIPSFSCRFELVRLSRFAYSPLAMKSTRLAITTFTETHLPHCWKFWTPSKTTRSGTTT